MPCVSNGSLTICRAPPSEIIDAEPSHVAWCFKCRERRMFVLVYEDPLSPWFDPEWRFRCDQCGELQTDMHGQCQDLRRWPEEAREAAERMEARSDSWPPATIYDEFERPVPTNQERGLQ